MALRVVRPEDVGAPLLEETYRRFSRYVAALAFRLSGHGTELEDVVQDVFLEAVRGINRLQHPEAIKGWLATITVRVVRRRLRLRRLCRFLGLATDVQDLEIPDRGASPADRALLVAVYRVLDGLPVDERVAWSLHHWEGEKLEAVARLCGCSITTAKRRIARARARIEEALGDG
jgi:RNA polymerase sigma-70 factor (ECF subfamily)